MCTHVGPLGSFLYYGFVYFAVCTGRTKVNSQESCPKEVGQYSSECNYIHTYVIVCMHTCVYIGHCYNIDINHDVPNLKIIATKKKFAF